MEDTHEALVKELANARPHHVDRLWFRAQPFLLTACMLIGVALPGAGFAASCGATERWFVKVGTDPDAHLVRLGEITQITVQGLNQL